MPAPERDGGKDSRHGGKERVIQAAKPLGTVAEIQEAKPLGTVAGIQGAKPLGTVAEIQGAKPLGTGQKGYRLRQFCWRQVSANKDLNH